MVYFETSALTKQGIDDGFSYIVNEAYEKAKGVVNKNISIEDGPKKEIEEKETGGGCFGRKKKKKKDKKNEETKVK